MGLYQTTRRVEFRDTDAAGIMHFSTYFLKMEEVEHEFLRSLGLSVVMPGDNGTHLSWPRVAVQCDYRGAARFEQVLEIDLGVERLGQSSVSYVLTFRIGQQTLATGKVTAVFCRFDGAERPQPLPIPADIRAKLTAYLTSE